MEPAVGPALAGQSRPIATWKYLLRRSAELASDTIRPPRQTAPRPAPRSAQPQPAERSDIACRSRKGTGFQQTPSFAEVVGPGRACVYRPCSLPPLRMEDAWRENRSSARVSKDRRLRLVLKSRSR